MKIFNDIKNFLIIFLNNKKITIFFAKKVNKNKVLKK